MRMASKCAATLAPALSCPAVAAESSPNIFVSAPAFAAIAALVLAIAGWTGTWVVHMRLVEQERASAKDARYAAELAHELAGKEVRVVLAAIEGEELRIERRHLVRADTVVRPRGIRLADGLVVEARLTRRS